MSIDPQWERRRILVWGKTRPEISKNYRETVCTGGVFQDTKSLVRLYPIPLRYLDTEKVFAKYQWIEADVQRNKADRRPESYRIRAADIQVHGKIDTDHSTWSDRAQWILQPQNCFQSVEALQAKQKKDHTSLGLIRPKKIVQVISTPVPSDERNNYWRNYKMKVAQLQLEYREEEPVKPLTPPDFRFQIRFTCDDPACEAVHKFSVLDWEVDALYSKMRHVKQHPASVAAAKCVQRLEDICAEKNDTRFFLGNISTHQHVFTIVGFWYPKKQPPNLLDAIGE